MKRQVSLSTFTLQWMYSERECLRIVKDIGADAVDFNLNDYSKANKACIYSRSDEEICAHFAALKRYADELGIAFSQTHGRIEGFKNCKEADDLLIENARIDLMVTAVLGAPICVVHSVTTIFMGPDADPTLMRDLNFEMFTRMLPYAKRYGVIIASETFGDADRFQCCDFFGNLEEFIASYERVCAVDGNGPYFKLCVDTGHSNKAMRFGNPSPGDVIRRLGANTVALHLHDNDTLKDQHKIPLTGTIDWKDVLKALDEVGYEGVYNLEVNLCHFGKNFMIEEAAFAVKVLKNMLRTHDGE